MLATTEELGKVIANVFNTNAIGFTVEAGRFLIEFMDDDDPSNLTVKLDNGQVFTVRITKESVQ